MSFVVCGSPRSQSADMMSFHLCRFTWHGSCPIQSDSAVSTSGMAGQSQVDHS